MLFDSSIRNYEEHQIRGMSAFEFLNISAWKIADYMRLYLNDNCSDFSKDNEFIKMYKSKIDKQHYSAAFELMVHIALANSLFTLEKHPNTGSTKRPDFKAIFNEPKDEIFLECTLSGNSYENSEEKNKKATIEEIIDSLEYFPFHINVHYQKLSDASLPKRNFIKFLNELKTKLIGFSDVELVEMRYLYEDAGWELEISFLNKGDKTIKRSVGVQGSEAKFIDSSKPILTALNDKKASRYKIHSEPYIVCLNTSDLFTKENCFAEALFGQYDSNEIDLNRDYKESFFIANKNPINTSVSAVIIFRNFDLFTLDSSTVTVWHNPFSKNPVRPGILPFTEYVYNNIGDFLKRVIIPKEKDIFEILRIDRKEYLDLKSKSGG